MLPNRQPPHFLARPRWVGVVVLVLFAGCHLHRTPEEFSNPGDGSAVNDGSTADTRPAVDAADTTAPRDSSSASDTPGSTDLDTGPETSPDAPTDTSPETSSDSSPDTASDTRTDTAADTGAACTGDTTKPCGTNEGICKKGERRCENGTWTACKGGVRPEDETCDGEDDDCDGTVDEGVKTTYFFDGDGDGYGIAGDTKTRCQKPANYVEKSGDCDDSNDKIHPGATENCVESVDRDCDDKMRCADPDCDGVVCDVSCGRTSCDCDICKNQSCTEVQESVDSCN